MIKIKKTKGYYFISYSDNLPFFLLAIPIIHCVLSYFL
ncbi:hypothetical protein CHRY9293_01354 [Chryseobacterium potabilaquae]|uniref:Uncharacterized protein n=1 Tax=Chryseobacterium potabilaquae TaxID=2675057 RepID=A0A6N4X2Q7_9FLAO|nr:hypothetical protein CHRY9293_01354 [Chryseobacterium potabilaquae]